MTISTTTSEVICQGNGVETLFSYSFVPDNAAFVNVYYTDASNSVTLLQPTQYTITINATPSNGLWGVGGTVTYPLSGSPIATGTFLTIVRSVPYTQTTSISNQGTIYPQAIEMALDTLCLEIQQLATTLFSRALLVPIASDLTPEQYLQYLISLIVPGGVIVQTANILTTTASSYIVQPTDYSVLGNAASNAIAVTLPNPATYPGRLLQFKKTDATANQVSFVGTVDGITTYALVFQNQSVTLQSNGAQWNVF